ncbi:MAG: nucleoside triphosphate pyrophosphatase [Gammaproteobacteria bacterium]
MPALLLASRSPRRAEYLRLLGVDFEVIDVAVDETPHADEAPRDYVLRLARAKAAAGRARSGVACPVLAADTTVVCAGEILGKPADAADARRILGRLSGRWHTVLTAVALAADAARDCCVETAVLFRPLSPTEIDRYWASGEPADKAGAYGIQGLGGALVSRIDGSYSNVVGLPLAETVALLDAAGIRHTLSG